MVLVRNCRKVDHFSGDFFSGGQGGAKRVRAAPKSLISQGTRASLGGPERCPRSLSAYIARNGGRPGRGMQKNGEKRRKFDEITKNMAKLGEEFTHLPTWIRDQRHSDQKRCQNAGGGRTRDHSE